MFKKHLSFRGTRDHDGADSSRDDLAARYQFGLQVVHRPKEDRQVDIVFVHGLGGGSWTTWSYNHDFGYFWPLHFLPNETDFKHVRILTFGYNANWRRDSGRHKMSILDFAKDLLYEMKFGQDESNESGEPEDLNMGERPIIFVVHSMGGLVVKEAYMQGQYDPRYEAIIKAVSSIVFLSTPHRGTNLAMTLNRILQVSFVSNPKQYIAELTSGSQTLQKLNEQFRHVAPKLQIVSFYETRPTALLKNAEVMVLERDSSVLGYPGEISKPLDADHHGVCKYKSPEDPLYKTVRNVLKSLVGKVNTSEDSGDGRPGLLEAGSRHRTLASFLAVAEMPDGDYNFFHDRWTPGTCGWILNDATFSGWIDDTTHRPRILWLSGNAASGKSTLSSFIVDHLVQLGLPCSYFFIRFSAQEKRGLSLLLRSLAAQLAASLPQYAERLQQLEATATNLKTADHRTLWQWLFKQALSHITLETPFFWVIDGLDEAEQPNSLLKLFQNFQFLKIPLRVIIASRKTHEISSAIQKLSKQIQVDSVQTPGNQADFRSFIEIEMDLAGDEEYRQNVVEQLLSRAQGNFLWVHLAVKNINACHTRPDVESALKGLPSGMEELYSRMAQSIELQKRPNDKQLGLDILGWTACACRPLSIDELGDALRNGGVVLDLQRTIGDLCGGFVTVDPEGNVALIHETAREYLTGGHVQGRPFCIEPRATHELLLKRCLASLANPTLRNQISRGRSPALLGYAMTAWSHHFDLSGSTSASNLHAVTTFLRSQHILTWIHVAAQSQQLQVLAVASRLLADAVIKIRRMVDAGTRFDHRLVTTMEGWATDLVKVVGKFGLSLSKHPESIYRLIPPFCPHGSMLYQQFGCKESCALSISGFTGIGWDDCLARYSFAKGNVASAIIAVGNRIAVLTVVGTVSTVIIYNSTTFEEKRRMAHQERVQAMQASKPGDLLVTYGYLTTKLWNVLTGECLKTLKNPPKRPRPHSIVFAGEGKTVVICFEDRVVRKFSTDRETPEEWLFCSKVEEDGIEGTTVNFPMCSALSPDGNAVAFGYRRHPVTVWELEPPVFRGQCNIRLNETNMTREENTWGEVFQVAWHPFSGEIFGLDLCGLMFRWDPFLDDASLKVDTGAKCFAVSGDGSLIVTGDALGIVKVYATADFSVLYQLASQDRVLDLTFSADSRRLYDSRSSYCNVWEPNVLVRLADSTAANSDAHSETESLAKVSLCTEHFDARLDNVLCLAAQTVGSLYCYGTENGLVNLAEVGHGKVAEVARLKSFMSIEHVAWSDDGKRVAYIDLTGKLVVKSVVRSTTDQSSWDFPIEFEGMVRVSQGHIRQLIFHPTGRKVFAPSLGEICVVDLTTMSLHAVSLPSPAFNVCWARHPTDPDRLVAFGLRTLHIFRWDLQQTEVLNYLPPKDMDHPTALQRDGQHLGRLISCIDSPVVLLQLKPPNGNDYGDGEYLIFDIDHTRNVVDTEERGVRVIPYTLLPSHVATRIREPLGFSSRGKLVFLDIDRWICSWRSTMATAWPSARRASEVSPTGVEQCYFLPGDWATGSEARLVEMTPDGTLLCPRNGEVGAVQWTKLRR